VRYDRRLHPLHDAQDLPALIQMLLDKGGRAHFDNQPFQPNEQDWLPYILEWETIGPYRF
jgi:hypothetical protein